MNFSEIKKLVIAEYDRRNLASSVRYHALEKFDEFLKKAELWNDVSKLPDNKHLMKAIYAEYRNKVLNNAESSMINEVYNQLSKQGIKLTDYSDQLKGRSAL